MTFSRITGVQGTPASIPTGATAGGGSYSPLAYPYMMFAGGSNRSFTNPIFPQVAGDSWEWPYETMQPLWISDGGGMGPPDNFGYSLSIFLPYSTAASGMSAPLVAPVPGSVVFEFDFTTFDDSNSGGGGVGLTYSDFSIVGSGPTGTGVTANAASTSGGGTNGGLTVTTGGSGAGVTVSTSSAGILLARIGVAVSLSIL